MTILAPFFTHAAASSSDCSLLDIRDSWGIGHWILARGTGRAACCPLRGYTDCADYLGGDTIMRTLALCSTLGCAAFLCIAGAAAQTPGAKPAASFPAKPVRIIIPYPPGGTSDILARLLGIKITESWGQSVLVDNRTGANGNIGAEFVARAPADGYTYLVTDIGNLSVAPNVFKLNYDPHRDLAPVTTISYSPHLLTTHPSLPVKNIRELIAFAKANPGKLNLPTGMGGATHFGAMEIAQRTGIKWTYIGTR